MFGITRGENNALLDKASWIPDQYQSVNVIDGEFIESKIDLTLNGPYPFEIKRWSGPPLDNQKTTSNGWFILPLDLFVVDKNLPKESIHPTHKFIYEYEKSGSLKSLYTQSLDGKITFNGIKILKNTDDKLEIESINGQKVLYEFQKDKDKRKLLSKVKAPGLPAVTYTYQPHSIEKRSVIVSRSEPLGRSLQIEYYATDDFNNGKVKALKTPQDLSGEQITTAKFVYKPYETEVYDAHGHKTLYKYNLDKKLISIESQHPDGDTNLPYRVHRFYWQDGRMVSKTVEDGQHNVYLCETFHYDTEGRLIKETILGDLSGHNAQPFTVDENGQPNENSTESYSTIYTYTNDGTGLLLSSKEDNGKEVHYTYYPKLHLLQSRLILFNNRIIQREFFDYDLHGKLLQSVVDDGSSSDRSNLQDATNQKFVQMKSYAPKPNQGLPISVFEYMVDVETGTNTWLKHTRTVYTNEGLPKEKKVFDSGLVCREMTDFQYDSQGRLVSKTELGGVQSTYTYDEVGNPLRRTSSNDQLDTNFAYDLSNRLIRQEELSTDGKLRGITYRYDKIGNKIASSDSCGNTTEYSYDALNRLIMTTLPAVLSSDESPVSYVIKNEYDLFDRIIKTINPDGDATETKYNARGKPVEVRYFDGTSEKTFYNLDGSLKEIIDRNGFVTKLTYDGYDRTIDTTVLSPNGVVIKNTHSTYQGFRLLSIEDRNQKKISYNYDTAGRLSTEEQGSKKIAYEYDNYGLPTLKKEWFGNGEQDFRATRIERDQHQQILKIFIEDNLGNVLLEQNSEDEKKVGSFGESDAKVANDRGQLVWQNTVVDVNGMVTESTLDALGRIEKVIKKDALGSKSSEIQYRYDASGNTCKEIHSVFASNQPTRTFTITKRWGLDRKLLELIEGEGSPLQKITRFDYVEGHLMTIQKPDGTMIHHEYNDLGQLVRLQASDQSFDYSYSHDSTGNIVAAEDHLTRMQTLRVFDQDNNLIEETLGSGLKSSWTYDRLGRLIHSTLPDQTAIAYNYNAAFLFSIERRQKDKSLVHKYTYAAKQGKVLQSELMGFCGTIQFDYQADGRPQSVHSLYWSQDFGTNGRDKLGRVNQHLIKDPLGQIQSVYQYDSLNRMIEEKGIELKSFNYDSLDNRLAENGKPWSVNVLNQLIENEHSTFEYDVNGNTVIEHKQGFPDRYFGYDALNRLTTLTIENLERYRYLYDPFNRRIMKIHELWNSLTNTWKAEETESYFYYGDQELGAATADGILHQLRVLGIGVGAEIGAAVLIELNGRAFVPIHDLQGSVRCLVDIETKRGIEFYRYTAFGQSQIFDKDNTHLCESAVGNPWLFSSKRLDLESGYYFFGKRYYSPDLGRWMTPDPVGFADGPNLYAFVHQNPLNALDLYGLFSFSDLWDQIKNFFINSFEKVLDFFQIIGNGIKTYLHPKTVGQFCKFLFYEAVAAGYALIRGDNHYTSGSGVYGSHEISGKVRVTFINGINTNPSYFEKNLDEISSTHGGVKIHYVYSATRGFLLDMLRAAKIKFGGFTSQEAYMLADTWRQMIAEMGGVNGGGTIVHYAHSIGAGDTEKALAMMTQEELAMIEVSTFGSPILIDANTSGARVVNYVNVRDGISILDPARYFKALFNKEKGIVFVGAMDGFPFIDHLFSTTAYYNVCEALGKYFMRIHGV